MPFSSCISKQIKTLMEFIYFYDQHVVVSLIMDKESAKSDENGRRKKMFFCYFVLESDKNPPKNISKPYIPNLYGIRLEFQYLKKNCSD